MLLEGRASSTRSKKSNSTIEAEREKTLKLAPPGTSVAPSGELLPTRSTLSRGFFTSSLVGSRAGERVVFIRCPRAWKRFLNAETRFDGWRLGCGVTARRPA